MYHLTVATRHLVCPKHVLEAKEDHITSMDFEPGDWLFPLIDYALHNILLDDPKEARRRSLRFYYDLIVKTLYHRSYNGILLCCLSNSEAQEVLKKDTIVYAELINQVRSSRIDCTGLGTIG